MADLDISLLGPVTVTVGEGSVALRAKERSLLAALALRAGRPVPTSALIDALWGALPPETALNTIQVHVLRLRRSLGRDIVRTTTGGYCLEVSPDRVDVDRFHHATRDGTRALAEGRPRSAGRILREALALWRGPALADCLDAPFAAAAAARLEELRLRALESRIAADLQAGPEPALVPELIGLCAEHPYREPFHAALVLALGRSGQTKAALDVYATMRRRLAGELGLEPGGLLRQAHREVLAGATPSERLSRGSRRLGSRPPAPSTRTIARDDDLAGVLDLIRSGRSRLITLLGPGGIGKTRVAKEVAPRAGVSFADGVCWVDLSGLSVVEDVAPSVAQALGCLPAATAVESIIATWADREVLLVLDNVEHLLPAVAPLVEQLLGELPGLMVLATSRTALRVDGEQRWLVPGLVAPAEDHPAAVETAPASALFLERARAVRPGPPLRPLDHESARAVARLCHQLEGNPLALEIAAARCNVVTPSELLSRVGDQLSSLAAPDADAPARRRSLRATLQSSSDMLGETERRLLWLLGVFRGGFTLDAAEAVVREATGDSAGVLDALTALEDASLLRRTGGEPARFELAETVRQHAAEMLAATGELTRARRAHLDHFLSRFCPGGRIQLWPHDATDIVARAREHDNVRAAVAFARSTDDRHAFAQLGLAYAGWRHVSGGLGAELDAWLRVVLADPADGEMEIAALLYRSLYAWHTARPDTALSLAEQAAVHPDLTSLPTWQPLALSTLAAFLGELDPTDARIPVLVEGALSTARSGADPDTLAFVLNAGASAYTHRDPDLSLAYFTELREVPANCIVRFAGLCNLAEAYLGRGRAAEAEALLREALELGVVENAPTMGTYALDLVGTALLTQGRLEPAEEPLLEALHAADWLEDGRMTCEVIQRLAALSAARGDRERAAVLAAGAAAGLDLVGVELSATGRFVYDAYLADLPGLLGDVAYSAASVRGRSLSLTELVALASSEEPNSPPYPG